MIVDQSNVSLQIFRHGSSSTVTIITNGTVYRDLQYENTVYQHTRSPCKVTWRACLDMVTEEKRAIEGIGENKRKAVVGYNR